LQHCRIPWQYLQLGKPKPGPVHPGSPSARSSYFSFRNDNIPYINPRDNLADVDQCGRWKCDCNEAGWYPATSDQLSCRKCEDPCKGDPCSSTVDNKNVCVPNYTPITGEICGTYSCECGGDSFLPANDQKLACERCIDPCLTGNDPCQSNRNNMNKCVAVAATPGAQPPRRLQSGQPLPQQQFFQQQPFQQQVFQQQPFQQQVQPQFQWGEFTVQQPRPTNPPAKEQYQPPLVNSGFRVCSSYVCQCDAPDWVESVDSKTCKKVCVNTCNNGPNGENPCLSTASNGANKCIWTPSISLTQCGHHVCSCVDGYLPSFGSQSCTLALVSPCVAGDPCKVTGKSGNTCVLSTDAAQGYSCNCAGDGYKVSADALTCVRA